MTIYPLKRIRYAVLLLFVFLTATELLIMSTGQADAARQPKKILVVTVTKGFRHASIPTIEKVIQQLSDQSHAFTVDYARTDEELATKTTAQALKGYDGIVFGSTTGKPTARQTGNPKEDDPPLADRDTFFNWIKAGHAFIGIHAATDTFHGYQPFIEMIGGEFKTHGPQVSVEALVEDPKHPATQGLGKSQTVFDEIYQFQNYDRAKVHMLLSLEKLQLAKDQPATPGYYPIAWCRMYGKGRVFYTALGHREDVLEADWYKRHLLGGIQWALGQAKGDAKPQNK